MNYEIVGKVVPSVEVSLSRGESMFTQSGGMFWQTEGIRMDTNTKGGLLKGIGRMFAGESMFMATYTATQDAKIAFASTVPGSIIPINVSEGRFTIQKGAFLAAESSVELKTTFNKKLGTGFFGGEGLFLTKLTGPGKVVLQTMNMNEFALRVGSFIPTSGS